MLCADAIIFAAGYEPADRGRPLGGAAAYCRREAHGTCASAPATAADDEHVEGAIYVHEPQPSPETSPGGEVRGA